MTNAIPPPVGRQLRRWLTADLVPDPDQPRKTFDEQSLEELAHSLTELGQQVPLLTCCDPANERRLIILDGERRWRAALRAKIQDLEVIVLAARPDAIGLLLAQVSINQCRESLTPAEQERAFRTLMDELKLTQATLAARLGVSPSKVCKVLARGRIDPSLLPLADQLETTVLPMIAALPSSEQAEAVAFATTPDATGKRPTRDAVKRHLEAKAAGPKPGPKAKWLAVTADGRAVRLAVRPDDTHDAVVEALKQLIQFVNKNRNVPVANLNLVAG